MPPTELVKFSKGEAELRAKIIAGHDESIEITLPDDIEPEVAVKWSQYAALLLDRNDSERAVYLQCAGRLHYLARTRQDILKAAKCKTLEEYEERILKCRNHRSTIYKISTGYKSFPSLTPDDVAEIGTVNLERASKIAKDASPAQKKRILDKAKELDTETFKVWVEEKSGLSSAGETTGASFQLFGTSAQIDELKTWLADAALIDWAGTNQPIGVVLAAIQSATTEIGEKSEEKIQVGQEPAEGW